MNPKGTTASLPSMQCDVEVIVSIIQSKKHRVALKIPYKDKREEVGSECEKSPC